jgi:exoribonuclease R
MTIRCCAGTPPAILIQELEIHGTVAEFMIFANHHVAARLVRAHPDCSLLRHHPLPTESHFATLVECARAKGN